MQNPFTHDKAGCAKLLLAAIFLTISPISHGAGRYVFISHAPDSDTWWTTVKNSLKHASEDFGVTVDYKNPKNGEIKEMARIIAESSDQKYDGMIVTIADFEQLKAPLQEVVNKRHIPLITVNSGTEAQSEEIGAILHIGQPEHYAGLNAGRKAKAAGVKSFVCLNHYASNLGSHERCEGFAEGLGVKDASELELTGDAAKMQGTIATYLTTHSDVDAMLALGPTSAHAALAALKDVKPIRPPYFVTFDLSSQISEAIHKGSMAFAIDQQPYLQGYLAVGLLASKVEEDDKNLTMTKTILYSYRKLHPRMALYGLMLMDFHGRHIKSGPAFVTRVNIDKVDMFSGTYR